MADNKVVLADGTVLIDLTEDTVTPQTMVRGTTAHDASGESVTGVVDLANAGTSLPLADGTASAGTATDYSREDHVHPSDPTIATKYTKPNTGIPFTDLADDAKMVVLYYGKSTWADFEAVYNTNRVVYCRASSNSNPASGSQTRMAFMAYVNNEASPTEVEFQYYRSVASHTDSQQGDQVFVYKLNKNSGWSVTTRNAFTKIATGTGLSHTYSSGTLTITNTETVPDVVSKTADGLAPQLPDETTTTKFLRQDASWAEPVVTTVNGHTVQSDVPANAVFTDTTYSDATTSASGLMSAADKTKLNGLSSDAATVNGHTVASDVPANAVFTDTHRPIQVDGTQILGSNTTPLNLVAGTNVTLTNSGGAVTIDASGGSGGSNPNLLNNWWFGEGLFHPSGQTPITADGYSGGLNIFGDAWHLRMGTVTKITTGSGDDSFTCWNIQLGGGQGNPGQFIQFLQNPLPPYPNGPYTLSVIAFYNNTPPCVLGVFVDDVLRDGVPVYGEQGFNLYQYTFDAPASFASHTIAVGLQKDIRYGQDASVHVLAMKLEVGTESTLAVQNAYGEWVLNDAPNNKLSLYGGIMTGRLRIQTTKSDSLGKNVLTLQNMNLSRSTAPSSNTYPLRIGFYDQNTSSYGFMGSEHLANGKYGMHMMATGPNTTNSLKLLVDSSNNRTVEVSDSAAWRSALGVVNKAGDTMTGSLKFEIDSNAAVIIQDLSADTNNRSSTKNTSYLVFRDKNNIGVASMRGSVLSDGYNSLFLQATAGNYVHNLKLFVDASGNRAVEVSDAAVWRDALGLGTNGAFPLTIAQGGTGSTTQNFVDLTTNQNAIGGEKTFTGGLTVNNYIAVKRSSGNAIVVDDQTADSSTNPSAATNYTPLSFRDKNGVAFGVVRARHTASGYKGLYIYANNSSAPSGSQTTALYMMVNNSGTKLVSFSDPDVWRDALELGTNGAFPLTIAQGGTGSTTKNFVDLSSAQTVAGAKTFTSNVTIDRSATTLAADAVPNILGFKYTNPQGYTKTVQVIRTYGDTEAGSNNGCAIIGSNSGTTVICAGESAGEVIKAQAISNTETLYLIADSGINLWTGGNQSTGAVTKAVTIASNGAVTLSSALPIGSGGTGHTAVAKVTTASTFITAATNFSVLTDSYTPTFATWGKLAQIEFQIKSTNAITSTGATQIATLKAGYRPATNVMAMEVNNGSRVLINTNGAVYIYRTVTAGGNVIIRGSFMLA